MTNFQNKINRILNGEPLENIIDMQAIKDLQESKLNKPDTNISKGQSINTESSPQRIRIKRNYFFKYEKKDKWQPFNLLDKKLAHILQMFLWWEQKRNCADYPIETYNETYGIYIRAELV